MLPSPPPELVEALQKGNMQDIRKYFDVSLKGCDISSVINCRTLMSETPLINALNHTEDYPKVIKFMLERGAYSNLAYNVI